MDKKKVELAELGRVSGGSGGFPDGEMPKGVEMCPRCGNRENLEFIKESIITDTGHPTIDSLVTDNSYRLYRCPYCEKNFWRYGNFWELA
ncbi:MAG: hypothetical protein J5929_06335 [Eubacterium sp.]|nr:hypothetical protein [Eubacterium sp.]